MYNEDLSIYKTKAYAIIDNILATHDYNETEIIILAAAMQIVKFEPDNLIETEIDLAHTYYDKYMATGDTEYREFAKHELQHAKKFLSILQTRIHIARLDEIDLYNASIQKIADLEPKLISG